MQGMKLTALAYQPNGVMGEGFWAVAFTWRRGLHKPINMVATVFESNEHDAAEVHPCTGRLAVLDATLAAIGLVSAKWRGDDFEPQLRQWIAQHQAAEAAKNADKLAKAERHAA
jgi:hypothetical protein